ncbi:hypothetical protein ABZ860_29115 [Microbispora sp. NPDC046973]|uniref:hypothetical protein n=1 Tax=Microbispora sp. NPDC046973 TaxID=3155022 RepID=UPI0033D70749
MDKLRGAPPLTLAALAAGSAAIHFGVMPDHFATSAGHGVLFAVAGCLQLAWAAALLLRPTQAVLLTGGFADLALVVIWLVGRTAGLPLGPDAWTPDPGGAPEALAALLETVLAAAAPVLVAYASVTDDEGAGTRRRMRTGGSPSAGRAGAALVAGPVACLVAAAVCASFTSWGTAAFDGILVARPATTSPGPLAGHHHHGPAQPPAPAAATAAAPAAAAGPLAPGTGVVAADTATSAADALAAAVRRETAGRLPTAADAERAGYRVWTDDGGVQQLANPALLQDGLVLDPAQPEVLVYHGGKTLLGAVFVMPPGARGPAIGPLTPWHSHTCPLCDPPRETDMLHVWLVDYPGGGFADISGPALQAAVAKLPPAS